MYLPFGTRTKKKKRKDFAFKCGRECHRNKVMSLLEIGNYDEDLKARHYNVALYLKNGLTNKPRLIELRLYVYIDIEMNKTNYI